MAPSSTSVTNEQEIAFRFETAPTNAGYQRHLPAVPFLAHVGRGSTACLCGALANKVPLPRAYEDVFGIWDDNHPHAAVRARAALDIMLEDLLCGPDSNAFISSALTMTGSPLEPAFSFADPGLRYTVDPAPPGIEPLRRLDYVLDLLTRLGAPAPPLCLIRRLAVLQVKGELRYGAQIGARHGVSADRYKLYIELPAEAEKEADAFGEELLGSAPVLNVPGRDARPTLVGLDLASGGVEIYYRIENLHPLEIGTLLGRANAAERAPELLAMLAESQPLPIRHQLPGAVWGFSYSLGSGNGITFSIFTFASTFFGPDGWARDSVLSMGRRHGWDLIAYEQMSKPLIERRGSTCHHGLFGLIVPSGQPPAGWVSLAPPESRT